MKVRQDTPYRRLATNGGEKCGLVFYSDDLEATLVAVEQAGGRIVKPVFDFPGGRRFHFSEPSDNEFAVWSALAAE
jgi:predicted enzyme related to lactoylglutathione lyase